MPLCEACISGVRHEGTPEGALTRIGDIDCYVATPSVEYAEGKVLLLLPDAMGLPSTNSQLLADDFARNGFKTVLLDCFDGEPIPTSVMVGTNDVKPDFDLPAFLARHPPARALEIARAVIAGLKGGGVVRFACTGYCYGGRTAFDLAIANDVSVVAASHPSLLKCPDDILKYAELSKAALLINTCEVDGQFSIEAQAQADEILGDGKFQPGYERTYWEGCGHGFAVRGDLSDPKVKFGKEGAFKATVEFLLEHFV